MTYCIPVKTGRSHPKNPAKLEYKCKRFGCGKRWYAKGRLVVKVECRGYFTKSLSGFLKKWKNRIQGLWDPELPSAKDQLVKYLNSMTAYVADGMQQVGQDEYKKRLETCLTCPLRQPDKNVCRACGCGLADKAKMRSEHCPKGKWPGDLTLTSMLVVIPVVSDEYKQNAELSLRLCKSLGHVDAVFAYRNDTGVHTGTKLDELLPTKYGDLCQGAVDNLLGKAPEKSVIMFFWPRAVPSSDFFRNLLWTYEQSGRDIVSIIRREEAAGLKSDIRLKRVKSGAGYAVGRKIDPWCVLIKRTLLETDLPINSYSSPELTMLDLQYRAKQLQIDTAVSTAAVLMNAKTPFKVGDIAEGLKLIAKHGPFWIQEL